MLLKKQHMYGVKTYWLQYSHLYQIVHNTTRMHLADVIHDTSVLDMAEKRRWQHTRIYVKQEHNLLEHAIPT